MSRNASELCAYYQIELRPEAAGLLHDELSPRLFFDRLVERGCLLDARSVLAHAMGRQRALWWGCLCAWERYRPEPPPGEAELLDGVGQLILEPSEARRRELETRLPSWIPGTPGGMLAVAALFGGGSIAPPNAPFVPPRPFVTGRLVSVAVYLAAVFGDPLPYQDRLSRFLTLGLDIALGRRLWDPSCAVAAGWDAALATPATASGGTGDLEVDATELTSTGEQRA